MKSLVRVLVPALSVVALFACDRSERAQRERDIDRSGVGDPFGVGGEKHGTTTVTGATAAVTNETAIERIVAARCAREASCDKIGGDKRFSSREVCTQKVRTDMRDDLKSSECPRGIDGKELQECLEEIRTESCNNPIDTLSRLAACRTSDLCLKADTTNR
jgi:hypothetical protein